MSQNQITTYDRFLTYPVAYTDRNPVKVANVAALLKTMASKLTTIWQGEIYCPMSFHGKGRIQTRMGSRMEV